jgi:putative transposase
MAGTRLTPALDTYIKQMTYNPANLHRRSVRLIGYDYSQAGAYFVTICTKERECLFGDIVAG